MPTVAPSRVPTVAGPLAERDLGYVPILMYHYVRSVDEAADPLGYRLSVTAERFAEQLAYLREQGYTSVTMRELTRCLRGEAVCAEKIVALTFDDGYEDSFSAALPLLRQHGFTATFYIVPNFVGRPGYMDWEQVRAMHTAGMEIGSHTMNHADLTGLSLKDARVEIGESKQVLEQQLGAPVVSFSYPAGSHDAALAEAVREAGYSNAVTTAQDIGFAELYRLARRRVLGGESIAGYPWYLQPLN
jgi:peptidoglycan/xylan/chitin deacetylase (PgdA/CDA1 family)